MKLEEGGGIGPQVVYQVRKDEDQAHPALEASTSGVVIDVDGPRGEPVGEYFWFP